MFAPAPFLLLSFPKSFSFRIERNLFCLAPFSQCARIHSLVIRNWELADSTLFFWFCFLQSFTLHAHRLCLPPLINTERWANLSVPSLPYSTEMSPLLQTFICSTSSFYSSQGRCYECIRLLFLYSRLDLVNINQGGLDPISWEQISLTDNCKWIEKDHWPWGESSQSLALC